MNYFGVFFTYMIPAMMIGAMAAFALAENARRRRREELRRQRAALRTVPRNKLYICSLEQELMV